MGRMKKGRVQLGPRSHVMDEGRRGNPKTHQYVNPVRLRTTGPALPDWSEEEKTMGKGKCTEGAGKTSREAL